MLVARLVLVVRSVRSSYAAHTHLLRGKVFSGKRIRLPCALFLSLAGVLHWPCAEMAVGSDRIGQKSRGGSATVV